MSLETILNNLPDFKSGTIIDAIVKAHSVVNKPIYKNPICSISGGSDSDIMLDIIHRVDEQKKVKYVWFDTGLEYKATKEHLKYLEDRYGIEIHRERAEIPIPLCTKKYGQPFINKFVSESIASLQRNNFTWTDEPYEDLIKKYPNCKGYITWWCSKYKVGDGFSSSMFNIAHNKWLKEFLIKNPPQFKIDSKCCKYAKKAVNKRIIKTYDCDLMISGVRKAEGGVRAKTFRTCYTSGSDKADTYRPVFWFHNEDKRTYKSAFNIRYSDCYEVWGFTRTGCVGCPYDIHCIEHNKIIEKYEPNMYNAVNNIFKESYEYTRQYKQFVREMNDKQKGRKRLF